MSTRTKLKFKRTRWLELMPDGYRLATVEEFGTNLADIKSRGFSEGGVRACRLLDGRILAGYRLEKSLDMCFWSLVVKEKVWDEETKRWKKKSSACYLPDGNLLRTKLYDGILSEEGRKSAFSLALVNEDPEVLCWLLKAINSETDLQGFQNLFSEEELEMHSFGNSYRLVKCLCASGFPFQLPLKADDQGKTPLDYLVDLIDHGWSFNVIQWIELFIELYSTTDIVHRYKIKDGVSFLDKATSEAIDNKRWVIALTKLLSVVSLSSGVENHISKIGHCLGDVLNEAVKRGYADLTDALLERRDLKDFMDKIDKDVCLKIAGNAILKGHLKCLQNMLNLLKDELQQDRHVKTLFDYAAKSENKEISRMLTAAYKELYREKTRDKWGRTFLHWAALAGQAESCNECIETWKLKADARDKLGLNSLHLAAKGINGHLVVDILFKSSSVALVSATDCEGRTPLHLASAKGNILTLEKILKRLLQQPAHSPNSATDLSQLKKILQQPDGFGKTALHMAAEGGHTRIVQKLLNKGIDPFLRRDVHGNTPLHCATGVDDTEVALAISKSLVNKYKERDDNRSLMLWASAAGIGTADERKGLAPLVKDYLLEEKAKDERHLLDIAAMNDNVDMVWELLNRGADISNIRYRRPINKVIEDIRIANEQRQDKPSSEDNLGRNAFAEGLAALFLNKFVESPITVGVMGEWGMGKSSLMVQTENLLLMAASQLSFPNLLPSENFSGAKKVSLSTKGQKIYRRMKYATYSFFPDDSISTTRISWIKNAMRKLLPFTRTGTQLVKLLEKYHPEYHAIYKSLACMDVHNQMLSSVGEGKNQFQAMSEVPRILTIRYNAWHYRDEHEAWAGLAVTITKEIEQVMTRAQKFNTWWTYSWAKNGVNMCIQIFLPCLLAIFLAGWVAWGVWTLLKEPKFKDLKYGSIPFTIIAIVWGVLKSIISAVKPVSIQMMGYINSPDHTARLGYQQQVISDINFLKGQLGKKPHWFFSFISGEWCWNWFGLYPDHVENTCIPKFSPASEDQLRVIAFVDDLDRCDEKVIIQVLSAINLVLAECKINVIMGIDKKMIRKALERHFEDKEDRDLADKFICKIIQIPLSLPDLTVEESNKFLHHYLGQPPPTTTTIRIEDGEDVDYGEIDSDNDDIETSDTSQREASASVDIPSPDTTQRQRNYKGIVKQMSNQLICFFQNICLLACNLSSELRQMQDAANKKEICSLTFTKGARLTREMLLSKYSPKEAETLYKLREFVTGSQKLPREWKRFLDYYKFSCNILSIIGKVYKLPSWRVELMTWTFICWQWKHEMNMLIKDWHKYVHAKGKVGDEDVDKGTSKENEVQNDDRQVRYEDWFGPSLKQVVKNYVVELYDLQKVSNNEDFHDKDRIMIETQEDYSKLKECLKNDPFVKAIFSLYGHDTTTTQEREEQYSNWINLFKVLHDVQDVSMKGIQLFQQFRLHCEIDSLPWPLLESNAIAYNRLMHA